MTLQLEIEGIAPPSIPTARGTMKCSSLRPGDWIRGDFQRTGVVLINSAKLYRLVIWFTDKPGDTLRDYGIVALNNYRFIGQGSRRRWHAWLPKFLQKRICPYSKP